MKLKSIAHDVHARGINNEFLSELSNDRLLDEFSKLTFRNPLVKIPYHIMDFKAIPAQNLVVND
jgi:hypothetical protein